MIIEPICFVLGAGASYCYNFPLGKQLCEMLTASLKPSKKRDLLSLFTPYSLLLQHAPVFNKKAIDNFRRKLLQSAQNSVDAFFGDKQRLFGRRQSRDGD